MPFVYPVVVYHGREEWTAPDNLRALQNLPPPLDAVVADFGVQLRYRLIDLSRIPDPLRRASAAAGLVLSVLRNINQPLPHRHLRGWGSVLDSVCSLGERGVRLVRLVVSYLLAVDRELGDDVCGELSAGSAGKGKEVVMNAAERLRAEGRAEGRQEGRQEGRAEGQQALQRSLTRLLERRFGALPPDAIRRIEEAPADELERWIIGVLTAATLEDALS